MLTGLICAQDEDSGAQVMLRRKSLVGASQLRAQGGQRGCASQVPVPHLPPCADLERMYTLFLPVPEAISKLREAMQQQIVSLGMGTMEDPEVDKEPIKFMTVRWLLPPPCPQGQQPAPSWLLPPPCPLDAGPAVHPS